jgi:GntR family histidine utilization transcriptional repressor
MARKTSIATPPAGPLPLYERVKRHVMQQIGAGTWRVNHKLPSEYRLADELGVSRLTVHRALRELTSAGILQRLQGVGTFVAPPKTVSPMVRIHNVADEIRDRGQAFSATVHALDSVRAPADVAAAMAGKPGSRLFHSVIIYRADDIPVQLEDRYVLPAFAPCFLDQDFQSRTTTAYLQSIAPPTEAEHVIEAIMPDARERQLLRIGANEPCLMVTRKTWVDGQITTYTRFIHPGSRHKIWSRVAAFQTA